MTESVRDDSGVAARAAAVRRVVGTLPAGACTLEEAVVTPRDRRGNASAAMLGITITPARDDAAAIFILLSPGGYAVLLVGSGERRNRYELGRLREPLDELGVMLEAIFAGRIEEHVAYGRGDRVLRFRTTVTLSDGTTASELSVRRPWGRRRRSEHLTYRPYA